MLHPLPAGGAGPRGGTAGGQGSADPAARRELLRRYLRFLGPATPAHLAEWLGIARAGAAAARPWWDLVAGELVEVRVGRRRAWLLERDLARLRDAPAPRAVRLLGPNDPYLRGWDRELAVPEAAHRRAVWNVLGSRGVLLVAGEVAGTWAQRAAGRGGLTLAVRPFAPLGAAAREGLEREARSLARLRGATRLDLRVKGG